MSMLEEYKQIQQNKSASGTQRKSILQEYTEKHGSDGLNKEYVDYALKNGGGFGATNGGIKTAEDGSRYIVTNTYTQQAMAEADAIKQEYNRQRAEQYRKGAQAALDNIDELKTMRNTGDIEKDRRTNEFIKNYEKQYEHMAAEYEKLTGQKIHSNFWGRLGDTLGGIGRTAAGMSANSAAVMHAAGKEALADTNSTTMGGLAATMLPQTTPGQFGMTEDDLDRIDANYQKIKDWGSEVNEKGQTQIDAAKYGLGKVGQFAVDAGVAAGHLGIDAALAAIPGIGPALAKASLMSRAYGGAAFEAEAAGASIQEQSDYGMISAVSEFVLEQLSGVGSKLAYGKGFGDDVTEEVIAKLAKTDAGRTTLRTLASFKGEFKEEFLSSVLNPVLKLTYDDGAAINSAYLTADGRKELISNAIVEGLIGGVVGLGGQAVNIATGADAAANAELRTPKITKPATVPQNAPTTQGDIQTPTTTTKNDVAQSEELNQPTTHTVTPKVSTKPVSDATITSEPQSVATQNTTTQEAMANDQGRSGSPERTTQEQNETGSYGSDASGRGNDKDSVQPGQSGRSGEDRGTQENRINNGAPESNTAKAEGIQAKTERARRVRDSLNARVPEKAETVREKISEDYERFNSIFTDGSYDADQYFDNEIDDLIEIALQFGDEGKENFIGTLVAAGVDQSVATEIVNEVLENESSTYTEQEDDSVPFTMSEEKEKPVKPMEVKRPVDDKPKAVIEHSKDDKGNTVATVKKEGIAPKLDKDTKTVRFTGEKYEKKDIDRVSVVNKETGSYIVQRGAGEEYYVVNKHGDIEGAAYSNFGQAKSRLFGKTESYMISRIPLADNSLVYYEDGQVRLDTDHAFTDKGLMVNHAKSMAAEDLGVEFNSYLGSAVNTDIAVVNFSGINNEASRKERKISEFQSKEKLKQILVGKRRADGSYAVKPGIVGENGKRYVFAGQTSNQRKKNEIILMEENAYNSVRKNMLGGLTPEEIESLNSAKYLANSGTYFSPSNADTGVKVKDSIVCGDIFTTMHNITRKFHRTTDGGLDRENLIKAGMTPEEADAKLAEVKVGQAFLLTGDLIKNQTDGTGFIYTEDKGSFQFRSAGGFKGLLQSFDFVSYFENVIPFNKNAEYVWVGDDGKTVSGGVRYQDKEVGVEILDRWGTWQPIKGKKALLFDSTVKFAGAYKSSDDFYSKAGEYDIRSVPKENVYGANYSSESDDENRAFGLAQLLRSQGVISKEDYDAIINENVQDVIQEIIDDPKKQARLFGVDFDSKKPPASTDIKALTIWYFGEDFMGTPLGKKWVSNKLGKIVEDARGGKLIFKKDKANYQWVAPDPFGVVRAMTSLSYQVNEREAFFNPQKARNITKGEGFSLDGYKGLKRGEIANAKLGKGNTLIGRYPSMEENDVQIRRNVRNEHFDTLFDKYGLSDDITYVALNDELSLNLDNDYDGDTVIATQGALAEAIRRVRTKAGVDKASGAKIGGLYTEISHGTATKSIITDADVIYASVKLGLDAESIGKYDIAIDRIQSIPSRYLTKAAKAEGLSVPEYRALLTAEFAAAYKLSVDFAKTGYYDTDFKKVVDQYIADIETIAAENGFFTGIVDGKKFIPVPASWEHSKKPSKAAKFEEARRIYNSGLTKGKKTIFTGGDNILSMILGMEGELIPSKGVKDYYEFYKPKLDALLTDEGLNFSAISTIDPSAYSYVPSDFIKSVVDVYDSIMRAQSDKPGNAHRTELLREVYNALGLDAEQFSSLMLCSLSIDSTRKTWDTLLNFDQKDGTESVSKILARNMRILGNLATISDGIKAAEQSIEKIKEDSVQWKEELRQAAINKYGANEIMLQQEVASVIDEVSAAIDKVKSELGKAEKTKSNYEGKALNAKTLEAYMKATKGFEKHQAKVQELQTKLDVLMDELNEANAVDAESKELLSKIVEAVNENLSDDKVVFQRLTDRLEFAQEDYNNWLRQFERENLKQEFYGIGVSTDTGLNNIDLASVKISLDAIAEKANAMSASARRAASSVKPKVKEKSPPKVVQKPAAVAEPKSEPAVKTNEQETPKTETKQEKPSETKAVERVNPKNTYGPKYGVIEKTVDSIAKNVGENATVVIPDSASEILNSDIKTSREVVFTFAQELVNSVVAEDDGASIKEFAKSVPTLIDSSKTLKTIFGDKDTGHVAKYANAVTTAKNSLEMYEAVKGLVEVVNKELQEFPNTCEAIRKWRSPDVKTKADKMAASEKLKHRFSLGYLSLQRNMPGIFKMLDGYDKRAGGAGYAYSDMILRNGFNAQQTFGEVTSKLAVSMQAFDESQSAKKTVVISNIKKGEVTKTELSLAQAIDLLHLFETLEDSKINPWKKVSYVVNGEIVSFSNVEQFKSAKDALSKAVAGGETAEAYYDALGAAYGEYKQPINGTVLKASGRNVEMYEGNRYYPILNASKGETDKTQPFDFDSVGFTHGRVSVEGGTIRVMDPAERFAIYSRSAMNLMARAEISTTVNRLDRGGIIPSMSDVIEQRFGKAFVSEFKQFKNDANNIKAEKDFFNELMGSARINYQGAVLASNLGSIIKNASSPMYAIGILDFDSVMHGIAMLKNEANRTRSGGVGAIRTRAEGFIDPNIAEVFENDNVFKKALEKVKLLNPLKDGFEKVDEMSMMAIYLASEYQVEIKDGIAKTDPRYSDAVISYFQAAYMQTQPQYDSLMRPLVSTSSNEATRMLGMFKTQPLANFNLVIDKIGELSAAKAKYGENSKEYKSDKASFGKVAKGLLFANAIYAMLDVATKAIKHKLDGWREEEDEDEDGKRNIKLGKIFADFAMTFVEAIAGTALFGDDAASFAFDALTEGETDRFYSGFFGVMSSIDDAIDSVYKAFTNPTITNAKTAAGKIANLFGIGLNTAYSLINGVVMYTLDITGQNPKDYDDVLKLLRDKSKEREKQEEDAVEMLIDAGGSKTDKVDDFYGVSASKVAEITSQVNAYKKQDEYDTSGAYGITSILLKSGLSDEGVDALIQASAGKPFAEKYDILRDNGYSPNSAVSTLKKIDSNGNGSVTQAELKAAYKNNPGLDYVLGLMFESKNKTWDSYKNS